MTILKMSDLDLAGKRVLIRQDLNAPVKDGKVANDKRLRASLPTLKLALEAGAKVIVMTHRGRPKEGEFDPELSLAPVAEYLRQALKVEIKLVRDWRDGVDTLDGGIILLENIRYYVGEKANDPELAKKMAALCDIYVNDAFGTAHRSQASTEGVARYAPAACAGPVLSAELDALGKALDNPARPMVAIVGGSKVSTKLTLLGSLSKKVDRLIVGGGIANTFIAAMGHNVGRSLYEPDLVEESKKLMAAAKEQGGEIPVPVDVIVARELSHTAMPRLKKVDQVADEEMIVDIGPETAKMYAAILKQAGTIVWNGPVGVFEYDQFAGGTKVLAHSAAESPAFSIIGGGDTVAAIEEFGLAQGISYLSTGGGAFLEFLEGKKLPAVAVLEERAKG